MEPDWDPSARLHTSRWLKLCVKLNRGFCGRKAGGPGREWTKLTPNLARLMREVENATGNKGCLASNKGNLVQPTAMPEEPSKDTMTVPAAPDKATVEKSNSGSCPVTSVPLVNEVQLTAATGGAEMSCYRCTVPFGVVVLIAGIVVTAVAYRFNSHGSTISVLGLVLLSMGLLLLGSSAVCWKVRMERKKDRRRESQTALMVSQRSSFA
ncbi:transmembrane protein 100-like [Arapaima gigas]